MNLLNETYNKSCRPKCESYIKISNKITLIDNFFENFKSARNFFINRDKWECTPYQDNSKPGYESIFPHWVGKSIMEKFILDNKIVDDMYSYKIACNFFYNELKPIWTLANSCYFPHMDSVPNEDVIQYICLINLNNIPVSTKFYTYKNQECCNKEIIKDFEEYMGDITEELLDYYGKKSITVDEFKMFLDKKQDLSVKSIKEVEFKPNQAIVYPANLFHSPKIPQEFTKDNPRILLRIIFDKKITELEKNLSYS
jgi:hypothetical protein